MNSQSSGLESFWSCVVVLACIAGFVCWLIWFISWFRMTQNVERTRIATEKLLEFLKSDAPPRSGQ